MKNRRSGTILRYTVKYSEILTIAHGTALRTVSIRETFVCFKRRIPIDKEAKFKRKILALVIPPILDDYSQPQQFPAGFEETCCGIM